MVAVRVSTPLYTVYMLLKIPLHQSSDQAWYPLRAAAGRSNIAPPASRSWSRARVDGERLRRTQLHTENAGTCPYEPSVRFDMAGGRLIVVVDRTSC